MDRIVTATEANQRFSELLREVSAGESFTITSRGKPVAEITPPKPKKQASKEALQEMFARMDKLPGVVTGPWTRDDLYGRDWG
jgi:prevent-host-death family protein